MGMFCYKFPPSRRRVSSFRFRAQSCPLIGPFAAICGAQLDPNEVAAVNGKRASGVDARFNTQSQRGLLHGRN